MKTTRTQTLFALFVVAGFVALTLSQGPASASASSERIGRLHIMKVCLGEHRPPRRLLHDHTSRTSRRSPSARRSSMTRRVTLCRACSTVTSSSTPGNGNRAVGRCTLDGATAVGICQFSDGIGELAGSPRPC